MDNTIASFSAQSDLLDPHPCNSHISLFLNFTAVSSDFISKLVYAINSSSSILDPLPTSILKNCLPVIIHHIKAIVNT